MQTRQNRSRNRTWLVGAALLIVIALLAAAYIFSQQEEETDGKTKVTLFMGYIPSVQFAPVYVAAERGYFADEGIEIVFENSFNEADGVERLASNNLRFGLISGEQVLLARANDRPIVYVLEWYHNFPVGIVSAVDQNITQPEDLRGRVVGIPGLYGASYIGFRALLNASGLTESDLGELRSIGFTAPENICEDKVEAAVIYIANEPLTIEQQCSEVNVIKISDYVTLVSNGLVTNEQTIREQPELVRGMVRAIQRGIADVIADPDAAFEISVRDYVKDLPQDQYETQRQVLANSIELWRSDQQLGQTTPAAWETTQEILIQAGLMSEPLDDVTACYDMSFLSQ
ncbi:MAG: ABC transporter substrate-binding protein [Chloroflexi bacterium]|nr:ABC transporter substrate-binding protein [Chloroflexota bacterium]